MRFSGVTKVMVLFAGFALGFWGPGVPAYLARLCLGEAWIIRRAWGVFGFTTALSLAGLALSFCLLLAIWKDREQRPIAFPALAGLCLGTALPLAILLLMFLVAFVLSFGSFDPKK
jgi:hypothetical protein